MKDAAEIGMIDERTNVPVAVSSEVLLSKDLDYRARGIYAYLCAQSDAGKFHTIHGFPWDSLDSLIEAGAIALEGEAIVLLK